MGFKAWRNLGVLALAGASLVGCTTGTASKDQKVIAPTPPGNSYNVPANQAPPPPNGAVFNNQQQPLSPNFNQGFGQQRPIAPNGFPQSSVPANPNTSFNQSNSQFGGPSTSTGGSFQAPSTQIPSTAGNNVQMTQPNLFTQPNQPVINNGPPSNTGFGTGYNANPNGFQSGGLPTASQPLPPALPPVPGSGSFAPIPPPTNFPANR